MSIFDQMEHESEEISKLLDTLLEMDNDDLYGESRLHELSFERYGKNHLKKLLTY